METERNIMASRTTSPRYFQKCSRGEDCCNTHPMAPTLPLNENYFTRNEKNRTGFVKTCKSCLAKDERQRRHTAQWLKLARVLNRKNVPGSWREVPDG